MSLAETPRPRRAILSLPGYAPPRPAAPVTARATGLNGDGGKVLPAGTTAQAAPVPVEPYSAARLSPTYWGRMRDELTGILAAAPPVVFAPRIPLPLKIGAYADLLTRYPAADPKALGRWLARWCSSQQYRQQLATGGPRFDLDGTVAGEISADAGDHARQQLERRAGRS